MFDDERRVRWFTFGISGRRRLALHHGQTLVIFAITYAATTVAFAVLGVVAPDAGTTAQTGVVLLAYVLSTAARFVAMQRWIFNEPTPTAEPPTEPSGPAHRHEPAYEVVLRGGRLRE